MKCKFCKKEYSITGLRTHEKICEKITADLRQIIINEYQLGTGLNKLCSKYKLSKSILYNILDGQVRSLSEANKLSHKLHPDSYKWSTERKLKQAGAKSNIVRKKSHNHYKQGWYKGYWCDSSWELAFVMYNIDHDIKLERNTKSFEYNYKNAKHLYYPDFILEDGNYVEIKGFLNERDKAKIDSFSNKLLVLDKNSIQKYLNYVIFTYGNKFYELYDNYTYVIKKRKKITCPQCGGLMDKRSKLCIKCHCSKLNVNSQKPNKEILLNQLKENNLYNVAKFYNVSDTTIRKWCKKFEINYRSLV